MSYYDDIRKHEARGIDYDLIACLEYNPQRTFTVDDIEQVLAVWTGENDGDDWRWVVRLSPDPDYGEARFAFIQGGCDYTGWDCQSWATHAFAGSAQEAALKAQGDFPTGNWSPQNMGLGQLINLLSGETGKNFNEVALELLRQVAQGKDQTWREKKDQELGLDKNPPKTVDPLDPMGDY